MDDERKIEKSKDELITNVSHDLRTPLTSIIGYLGLIEDKQYRSEEDILKYTHTAYEKAKQMKTLVDDLFEYTKVQQHGAPVNIMKIDLNQLIEQLTASFELEAQHRGIEITSSVIPNPLMIEADPEKLGRVFNNLVSNAFKYGNGASYIRINARQEMIWWSSKLLMMVHQFLKKHLTTYLSVSTAQKLPVHELLVERD